jgi:repressor LexA
VKRGKALSKETLSARQVKILQYILDFRNERSIPPTVRDIQGAENPPISSTSVVDYNLKALEEHGIIKRGRGLSRSIELVEEKVDELMAKGILHRRRVTTGRQQVLRIPMAGTPIAAGMPIPVLEELQAAGGSEVLEVDPRLLGRWAEHADQLYALPVKGQSMIDALITDGDIVIMARQETARDGEAVAVWLKAEQETTLKYFHHDGDNQVRLQPANTTMAPIITSADNVQIMGRLVSVLRRCD